MNIKHEMSIAMESTDKNGNIIPRNQDIIVIIGPVLSYIKFMIKL